MLYPQYPFFWTFMTDSKTNSKRIAKNTIALYLRMFLMMAIGLFTSRVVLQTLGVKDYGTYNVVGGVVGMFSIVSSSLSTSISRFITFELGRGNSERLNKVFSTAINVQLLLSMIVVVLMELVGVWFLNTQMNIPEGRMEVANWVFQLSIVSFVLGLLTVPYNASIIAHEDMGVFAYMSLLDAVFKLLIVYSLYISPFDKLISYAVLLFGVSLLMRSIYAIYCKRHYEECTYHFVYDKPLLKEMTGFAGWNFLGDGSWILNNHGVSILINIFFGVTLNAARGIASQVDNIVQSFVKNFMTAINPQITKSYAAGDIEYMHKLIFAGAKYSAFLMILFIIPIFLETDFILHIWLGDMVPDYASIFIKFTLLSSMCVLLGNTLITSIFATGKIRNYELVMGLMALSIFPLTWIALKMGASPVVVYVINFVIYFIMIFVRLFLVKELIHMSTWKYVKEVLTPVLIVAFFSIPIPLLITLLQGDSFSRFLEVLIVSLLCSVFCIYLFGIKQNEKDYLVRMIRIKILNGK